MTFNEKNFIGKVGGIEGRLTLTNRSHLSFGFTHSENKKEYVYNSIVNTVQVDIYYFTLRIWRIFSTLVMHINSLKGILDSEVRSDCSIPDKSNNQLTYFQTPFELLKASIIRVDLMNWGLTLEFNMLKESIPNLTSVSNPACSTK